ncbi:MAG: helix-turn-helix domain-containing protein [Acidimicrobiales bacterium]
MNEPDMYREWEPRPEWRHAVACLWEQRVGAARVQRVAPDGHADLLVYESGGIEVVGIHDHVALPGLVAGTRLFGVRLRPGAVAAAFRTPASSLLNRTVPAEDVVGTRRARRLRDERGLDAWLRSIVPNPRVTRALRLLATQPVAEVAEQVGLTARQLQRVLRAEVGLAPKTYQRVDRLQRFLRATDAGGALAAAAADAGFADQAHLTREVRRLSGLTPARLVAERRA